MKILMLVNWEVINSNSRPASKQPPGYYIPGEKYWFFRYFKEPAEVDVIDTQSQEWIENIERKTLRFYIVQTLRAIPKLKKYDLILSHGMQSGIVLSLFRRIFKIKAKHIVFDVGSFKSASESGPSLKLIQFASKSIDGVIYHTQKQIEYYQKYFPWIVDRSQFIKFGTDLEYFNPDQLTKNEEADTYILCVGYIKRDWDTLVNAYQLIDTNKKLRLVGHVEERYRDIKGVEQLPYISAKELKEQIFNALFCVLPLQSFNYSFGQMTLLQQMALKKLVIAARVPSIIDYIRDGETALFYSPQDIEDCSSVIRDVLDGKYDIPQIGESARNDLDLFCNEKIMAHQIENFLYSILNKKK